MIDNALMCKVINYNKYKRHCFNNYIPIRFKDEDLEKVLKARYNKISRIKKHLVYLLSHRKNCYFITFTFSDKYINKCDRTKRDMIKDSLNSFSSDVLYILNIDFGKENEREHFHCIVGTDNDKDAVTHFNASYDSFTWVERIRLHGEDIKRVSKYINKLSNHCCKDTTKNRRIVYNFKGYDLIEDNYTRFLLYTRQCYKLGLL